MKINFQTYFKDFIPYSEKDNFINFINEKIKIIENEQNEINEEILNRFKNHDSSFMSAIEFNLNMNSLSKTKKYSDMECINVHDERLYNLLVVTFDTINEYREFQNLINEYMTGGINYEQT